MNYDKEYEFVINNAKIFNFIQFNLNEFLKYENSMEDKNLVDRIIEKPLEINEIGENITYKFILSDGCKLMRNNELFTHHKEKL